MSVAAPSAAAIVPFAGGLERHGDRPALIAGGRTTSYAALAREADVAASQLGPGRDLVVLAAGNDRPTVVAYLGALRAGHVVLLAPVDQPEFVDALVATYRPGSVVTSDGSDFHIEHPHRRAGPSELHPDLALLLSTSGSTGSPKLVRLSQENLQSNAEAIAAFLGLGPEDRGITSLPLHYCFGLSVLHSHIAAGAALVLSDRSVIEPTFWETVRGAGVTSLAGVPYTFDLLDRIGFPGMHLPALRRVLQAGGRLAPERVRHYAEAGRSAGWDLFVMYGQTEATARMAYLPPGDAAAHPSSIGVPIPGGAFEIVPAGVTGDDDEAHDGAVGELVYRGPNVMLGYAEGRADLALGRTVSELRTGDLARRTAGGRYEIVGRRSRFVKPFGTRLDLDRVEQLLADDGVEAWCAGDDHRLVVALAGREGSGIEPATVASQLAARLGLPAGCVSVHAVESVPRLGNGKTDYAAILGAAPPRSPAPAPGPAADPLHRLFADVLPGRPLTPEATFASLGGDSLSYVEASVRLEELLGHLPDDWPHRSMAELAALARTDGGAGGGGGTGALAGRRRPHRTRQLDTAVVLRALALVAVVGTHAGLFRLRGGAHLLLALAGFNFARFQLAGARATSAPPRLAGSLARVIVPSVAWLALLLATTDDYDVANLLLLYGHTGEPFWDQRWRYWYVEALVQILLLLAAVFSVPAVRRVERRAPFAFALGAVAVATAVRLVAVDVLHVTRWTHRPHTVVWMFAVGWLAAVADTRSRRWSAVALAAASAPSFFVDDARSLLLVGGLALLVSRPSVAVPRVAAAPIATVASASLYVYLMHWQVYPAVLAHQPPVVAVAACLLVGVVAWLGVERISRRFARGARSRSASWAGAGATAPALAG